jgi:hypothetical protein
MTAQTISPPALSALKLPTEFPAIPIEFQAVVTKLKRLHTRRRTDSPAYQRLVLKAWRLAPDHILLHWLRAGIERGLIEEHKESTIE